MKTITSTCRLSSLGQRTVTETYINNGSLISKPEIERITINTGRVQDSP